MKTVQESNKKSFRKKMFSSRSLFIVYILLPLLIVGVGFSAWSTITPTFSGSISSNVTTERVIDTNALMEIVKFEPYTQQLYYTGNVGTDGKLQSELHIETGIELDLANVYTVAKDCGKSDMYLSLILSLSTGEDCPIFSDKNGSTCFSFSFEESSKVSTNVGEKEVTFTVSQSKTQPEAMDTAVTLLLALNFSDLTADNPFSAGEEGKMTIIPKFILNADGYSTFFDLALVGTPFRLDLKLSENSPVGNNAQ